MFALLRLLLIEVLHTADPALDSGEIGYAGNDVAGNYLGASTDNRIWTSGKPWFASNNVVTLWPNVTTAPLNDPQVRLAISAGIDRSQLSAQGETSYEPPAKWLKNGQPIKFSIENPSSYTDHATDAQLIANQLNNEGFEVSFHGVQATQWYSDVATGNFQAVLRWSNQGPTPWDYPAAVAARRGADVAPAKRGLDPTAGRPSPSASAGPDEPKPRASAISRLGLREGLLS